MAADAATTGATYADLNANVDVQMQGDVDAHATTAGLPIIPPAASPVPADNEFMHFMRQFMMFMRHNENPMPATSSASGAAGSFPSGVQSGPGHLANVKLDKRSFEKVDKFTNKQGGWKEWRPHLLAAVRDCDVSFADQLEIFERQDEVVKKLDLNPTLRQLSATLHGRLISVTQKEAWTIATSCNGEGIEAWRQLAQRFDPQTDAIFANLVRGLIGFRIADKGQDVQTEMVKWEAMLSAMERDHSENFSPKMRRCLLLSILPKWLREKILEHVDRLENYGQLRAQIVRLVQVPVSRASTIDANNLEEPYDDDDYGVQPEDYTPEDEAMDLAALAEVKCHRCGKMGHFARNCKLPATKGRKGGGKGKTGGTRFMDSYGKGGAPNHQTSCKECNRSPYHPPEKCWKLHPELRPGYKKKVQGVEDEERATSSR